VPGRTRPIAQIEAELAAYFAVGSMRFETPLARAGSAFQNVVWDALCAIPPGQTRSYGELARAIGRPEAVRATARANGANQFAIAVPCHRVITADGALGGYGGGLPRKRWLLDHERRVAAMAATD
jgi:AraC family transcriptional regulator of adaptative response/methylated-DNA-[protein]-cysteine methyltransferase